MGPLPHRGGMGEDEMNELSYLLSFLAILVDRAVAR